MIYKKQSIDEFLEIEYTPLSRPCRATVVNRIKRGQLQGIKEGGRWYVVKSISTGNKKADEILGRRAHG